MTLFKIPSVAGVGDSVQTGEIDDNAVTLQKMASGTDGNIISYDANGDPVAISTGTTGQVLTSAGAGSPPTFSDAGSGAMTLIDSTDLSGGANTVLASGTLSTSTYKALLVRWVSTNASTNSDLHMNLNGSTASKYGHQETKLGASSHVTSTLDNKFVVGHTATTHQGGGYFWITLNGTDRQIQGIGGVETFSNYVFDGVYDENSNEITEVKLTSASGNLGTDTKMEIWGLK